MAENLIKSELLLGAEQKKEKKKLYKNWKLYTSALGIIVIGTGTGLGIYYGLYAHHSAATTPVNLNNLELNTTISGTEDSSDEQFFQTFLSENKNIFGDNLTLNQVELTNFEAVKVGQNGTLTITIKEGTNDKFTGSVDITLKYRLDDETIIDIMTFLSDNNQLNFQIPTGTKQSELMKILTEDFRAKLSDYYVYADDIESIDVTTPRYQPTQEQLDTKDFVWIPPKHTDQANLGISYLWLGFTVTYKDGTIKTPSEGPLDEDGYHHSNSVLIAWNLNATITMV